VNSIPAQAKCTRYNIIWYSLSRFCPDISFPPPIKLTARI